jgi:hypothetical protein
MAIVIIVDNVVRGSSQSNLLREGVVYDKSQGFAEALSWIRQ